MSVLPSKGHLFYLCTESHTSSLYRAAIVTLLKHHWFFFFLFNWVISTSIQTCCNASHLKRKKALGSISFSVTAWSLPHFKANSINKKSLLTISTSISSCSLLKPLQSCVHVHYSSKMIFVNVNKDLYVARSNGPFPFFILLQNLGNIWYPWSTLFS